MKLIRSGQEKNIKSKEKNTKEAVIDSNNNETMNNPSSAAEILGITNIGKDLTLHDSSIYYGKIREIALSPHCLGILISIFSSVIYGQNLVKFGLLLGLFGGSGATSSLDDAKTPMDGELSIRKDIHVLVVGDPGLGKSELLRAASVAAPRSIFVCGNTATTAGLTVALVRDGRSADASVEAGALVLADRFAPHFRNDVLLGVFVVLMNWIR